MTEPPTYVVIPVIEAYADLGNWAGSEPAGILIIPNSAMPLNLSAKWNRGLEWAEERAAEANASLWNVAILNDDIEVAPEFLTTLAHSLRHPSMPGYTPEIAYPNIHGAKVDTVYESNALAGQTMAGWAFMLKGEQGFRFDEQFRWWYGDSDCERQIRRDGGVAVCVANSHADHVRPMESTRDNPELLQLAREDERRFAAKWNIDPASLWLALNPEWGTHG